MPECLRFEKIKKTRKLHRCFACLELIEPGNPAYSWTSVDGGIFTEYLHEKCGFITEDICFHCRDCGDFDGYQEGFLRESINCGADCEGVKAFKTED